MSNNNCQHEDKYNVILDKYGNRGYCINCHADWKLEYIPNKGTCLIYYKLDDPLEQLKDLCENGA